MEDYGVEDKVGAKVKEEGKSTPAPKQDAVKTTVKVEKTEDGTDYGIEEVKKP